MSGSAKMSSGASPINMDLLRQSGCGVGDFRKLNISPADIRRAGFSFKEMAEHLGVARLKEAGFTANDFKKNGYQAKDLTTNLMTGGPAFTVQELIGAGYTFAELHGCVDNKVLKDAGFTPKDFLDAQSYGFHELKLIGFSDSEIQPYMDAPVASASASSSSAPVPASSSSSGISIPSRQEFAALRPGESLSANREGAASTFLKVTWTKCSPPEAAKKLKKCQASSPSSYSYEGSGKNCPACGRKFILLSKYTSSDGMCGVERGEWICDDAACGIEKHESYEGYGSIF